MPDDHVDRNRRFWDADADAYQAAHGDELAATPLAWGCGASPRRRCARRRRARA
ncbi:MAG: hypothetical protein M5U14_03330 [Acidimicrobiia bacterium]|nr:hypothetical protein [Acidimicrobiia bacterium]